MVGVSLCCALVIAYNIRGNSEKAIEMFQLPSIYPYLQLKETPTVWLSLYAAGM